jgi:endoglucanase
MHHPRTFAVLALVTASACAKTPPGVPAHDTSVNPGYHVVGNQVFDKNGAVHFFHGVDRSSLEEFPEGQNISANDFKLMATWKANVVRVSLSQDLWLGGKSYQDMVLKAVEWAKQAGMDVILDLHWSDRGDRLKVAPGQQMMPDENSVTFWMAVADFYKDDGRVLFELYNEPYQVTWDVWLNGGTAVLKDGSSFTAVGMQQLYDAIRSTGAQNIVIAGGLDWAYDLSGVATYPIRGTNIMYATHPYDNQWKQPSGWDAKWGYLTAIYPVIVTEFGSYDCSTAYTSTLIDYADQHRAHWTAWAWFVGGCGYPSLLVDWAGTPSAVGQVVKDALARYATQGMPVIGDGGLPQPQSDALVDTDSPAPVDAPSAIDLAAGIDLLTAIDLPALGDAVPGLDTGVSEAGGIDLQ